MPPSWVIEFHRDFRPEVERLPPDVRVELAAYLVVLREKGPRLGRPDVDTLKGSRHANMKELRLKVLRVPWRFAFAFDPSRRAVILCGGAKGAMNQQRFYGKLIDMADRRYDAHLAEMGARNG